MPNSTLADEFAVWVEQLAFSDLPTGVVHEAKASLRDFIANAVSGAVQPWMAPYRKFAASSFSPGSCTVAMMPTTYCLRDASFLNAVYCHAYEYDDILAGHPGSVVISTALGLAELGHLSGSDLITAIVAGYEIMCRATAAIHPSEVRKNFNGTGLAGPFGSTAVAGKLLGLSAARLTNALGIAGNYACGMNQYDVGGGESKRLYAGMSARAGIEAATLADYGLTGPTEIFEGEKGLFRTFGSTCNVSLSSDGLGEDFRILRRWCKAYPAVGSVHGAIDCMEVLCGEHEFDTADIKKITVAVPNMTVTHGGAIKIPWDVMSAQFSMGFSVAIRALFRSNRIGLYTDRELWQDSRVTSLIEKLEVVEDTDVADGVDAQVTMVVDLSNGSSFSHVQKSPRGTPANPLSEEELQGKYRECTNGLLGSMEAAEIDRTVATLEQLADVASFVELLRRGSDLVPPTVQSVATDSAAVQGIDGAVG
jgi:2-methylcitrate dehydratase PrpD